MKKNLDEMIKSGKFTAELSKLQKITMKAAKAGHYLEASIVAFQLVDIGVRLTIHLLAKRINLPGPTYKEIIEKEDRFFRLVNYLDLLKPGNTLSNKLRKLNSDRNRFIHGLLFINQSPLTLKRNLKKFFNDCADLFLDLGKLAREIVKTKWSETI